jgi:hypothetical protein
LIGSGDSPTMDALVDDFSDGHNPETDGPMCADNNAGELVYAYFINTWCLANDLDCSHQKLMEVWIKTACNGWCDSFKEVYGLSWGNFICSMEAADAYNIRPSCTEADVPCMAWRDPKIDCMPTPTPVPPTPASPDDPTTVETTSGACVFHRGHRLTGAAAAAAAGCGLAVFGP